MNQKVFQSFYWFSTNLFISKTKLSLLRIYFSQTNRCNVWSICSILLFKCIFDCNLISELLFRKTIFISHSSRCNSMLTLKPFTSDPLNGKYMRICLHWTVWDAGYKLWFIVIEYSFEMLPSLHKVSFCLWLNNKNKVQVFVVDTQKQLIIS
jgi:hypothetical protein